MKEVFELWFADGSDSFRSYYQGEYNPQADRSRHAILAHNFSSPTLATFQSLTGFDSVPSQPAFGLRFRASALRMVCPRLGSGAFIPFSRLSALAGKYWTMRTNAVTAKGYNPRSMALMVFQWTPANSARHSCVMPASSRAL